MNTEQARALTGPTNTYLAESDAQIRDLEAGRKKTRRKAGLEKGIGTIKALCHANEMTGDYEKLGLFYLGRLYDRERKQALDDLLLYDSKDLVTHAVCVGMTGSGKTGLCISLIEEAAIDGIPSIVIDPKGDLTNLLLTFPELRPEDFRPFVSEDEARNKGVDPESFAAQQAALWKSGLAEWDQSPDRIARLKAAAEFTIYTPASRTGVPVSVLRSFAAPEQSLLGDREAMRQRVGAAAASLLSLAGIDADSMQSREHILLSTILDRAWREGKNLEFADLVQQVQNPPVSKVGVMDLESFYPAKERFGLAVALNNLLASPGFEAWMEGEPLDIGRVLYTGSGKPRVAIFSIAHLGDSERMFFVSLLLNEIVSWMRTQSGTTSLRAVLYMDEIFGFFPPVANPPSKQPLLTLLKQARAFGIGVVLATQNPVDLDYKGLANAGTWFVGRLQTERDKSRLLDGLEGASGQAGTKFDREGIGRVLSELGSRVFLLHNVHEDAPEIFQTRWTLSYLRGPLSREQTRALAAHSDESARAARPDPQLSAKAALPAQVADSQASETRPVLPPDISEQFAPVRVSKPAGAQLVYQPMLFGAAELRFADPKSKVDTSHAVAFAAPITEEAVPVEWANATPTDLSASDLEPQPASDAQFADLPAAARKARSYTAWSRDFLNWLYQSERLELLRSPGTGLLSNPDESERDFRIRLRQAVREERDRAADELRSKYAPKIATLQEKLRRAQQALEREHGQASQQKLGTAISVGATLLGAFLGRKAISATTLGRASTAAKSYGRIGKEAQDVERANETVVAIQKQLGDMTAQIETELQELQAKLDPAAEELEKIEIRPKKTNITVKLVSLAWMPFWRTEGRHTQAW